MYYCLTGKLLLVRELTAVVSCGGVGYRCLTTLTTLASLPPVGEEVTLYTHLSVREDALTLYGFSTERELEAFRMLIGVSGVGPKSSLAILSDMPPDRLALCIASGDVKSLKALPGIGPKSAQRIILELKDKISGAGLAPEVAQAAAVAASEDTSSMGEAISALVVLGYSQTEAAKALSGLPPELAANELIKQALKRLASR